MYYTFVWPIKKNAYRQQLHRNLSQPENCSCIYYCYIIFIPETPGRYLTTLTDKFTSCGRFRCENYIRWTVRIGRTIKGRESRVGEDLCAIRVEIIVLLCYTQLERFSISSWFYFADFLDKTLQSCRKIISGGFIRVLISVRCLCDFFQLISTLLSTNRRRHRVMIRIHDQF